VASYLGDKTAANLEPDAREKDLLIPEVRRQPVRAVEPAFVHRRDNHLCPDQRQQIDHEGTKNSPTKKYVKKIVQQKYFQYHFTGLLFGGNLHLGSAANSF
jgi:hypothetical protein